MLHVILLVPQAGKAPLLVCGNYNWQYLPGTPVVSDTLRSGTAAFLKKKTDASASLCLGKFAKHDP